MSSNQQQKSKAKKSGWCNFSFAAFDMFGSSVSLNINGDDTYKTAFGCFWSVVMFASIVLALIIYVTQYQDKSNVTVTTELLIQDTYPKIDFKSMGFFFSLYATKGRALKPIDDLRYFLDFEAQQIIYTSSVDANGNRGAPSQSAPTVIPFGPCKTGGMGSPTVSGQNLQGRQSIATSDRAYCSLISSATEMYVEGDEDSDTWAYIRIKILPCSDTDTGCLFYYIKQAADMSLSGTARCTVVGAQLLVDNKITQAGEFPAGCDCNHPTYSAKCNEIERRIRDNLSSVLSETYFTLAYIEGAFIPENYEQPFKFTFKSNIKTHGSISSTKLIDVYFREVEVATDKGLFTESTSSESSVGFDSVMTDFIDRGEGKSKSEKRPDGTSSSVAQSYMEFTLYSSNNKIKFTRMYAKLVDVFANVGGVSEVVGFVIMFIYAWYNGIRMEQNLLNYGVLNKSDGHADDGFDNEKWENDRHFTFFDLVKFGFIEKGFFCCKKNKKHQLYEKSKESFENRTDITKIMKAVADVDTIKDALFTDYQIRLMPYLALSKKDDDSDIEHMSLKDALSKLKLDNETQDKIKKAMDDYLVKTLPKELTEAEHENRGIFVGKGTGIKNDHYVTNKMELLDVQQEEAKISSPSGSLKDSWGDVRKKGRKRSKNKVSQASKKLAQQLE